MNQLTKMGLSAYLYIMTGGALGSLLRYLTSMFIQRSTSEFFPWGTLAVNLIGAFFIGMLWCIIGTSNNHPDLRFFFITGLLGGFTTFSIFSFECMDLLKAGAIKYAFLYILASNIGGITLAFFGYKILQFLRLP